MENNKYCMSSFLMYRTVIDSEKKWEGGRTPNLWKDNVKRVPIHDSFQLEEHLKNSVKKTCENGKVALALSGGIDSAILAKFMPKGSIAYTFKCVVPGINVTDETPIAAKYARECGLEHRIVEIYWEDFEKYAPILMKHKGAPIHSIEVQIYKAAIQAKKDGIDTLIFGENADAIYGGMSEVLSQDWLVGDFINRYSYVLPYMVLKEYEMPLEPFNRFEEDGYVDPHSFMSEIFRKESIGSYVNAIETADANILCPFAETYLAEPIDYKRIRAGENKYLVREVFSRLYPDFVIPPKTPMPRPMNEWLKDWDGPMREEFWPHCTDNMTGDQKWLVWSLERFLDILEQ